MKIQKLHCAVQCYDWGCVGESSLVANLKKSADSNFIIEKKPYAEVSRFSRFFSTSWQVRDFLVKLILNFQLNIKQII